MANSPLNLFTSVDGKGLELFEYGYYPAPETSLVLFDMNQLNAKNVDFRNISPKRIGQKSTMTETGDKVEWYDSDISSPLLDPSGVNDAGSTLVVTFNTPSGSALQVGEELYNRATGVNYLITSISGNDATMDVGDANATASDDIVRIGFSKQYGADDGFDYTRPDSFQEDNYIEFTEQTITSDMITNNRNGLFFKEPDERLKEEFTDSSRAIVRQMLMTLYVGKKDKFNGGSGDRYRAGGMDHFIPSSAKEDIGGGGGSTTTDEVKEKFRDNITKATQSGLDNSTSTRVILCTTKFKQKIADLYENQIRYNDTLENLNIGIDEVDLVGYRARLIESNVLNEIYGDNAVAYIVPLDFVFLHVLPKGTADESGKSVQNFGKGKVYKKITNTFESDTIGLGTNFSYMFGGVNSGGYRKLEYTNI